MAFLGFGTATQAQFSTSYQFQNSQNTSGYAIEYFRDQSSGREGYIVVSTSYQNTGTLAPTNGVRITVVDMSGTPMWERLYTNMPDIHGFDICPDPNNNAYLFTGYFRQANNNRMYVGRVNAATGAVTGAFYVATGQFNTYNFHGLSITTNSQGQIAITGAATRFAPTPPNAGAQTNEMFLTLLTPTFAHMTTTLFDHIGDANNYEEVPLSITDVPNMGWYHITGSCQTNIPGRPTGVLSIFFDYAGNYMCESSFMDMSTQDSEIGQYNYFDPVHKLIYILTYKANSRSMGIYMLDPNDCSNIQTGLEFKDPNGVLYNIQGLCITKDNTFSPDQIFISGYIPDNGVYDPNHMPLFTTEVKVDDLRDCKSNQPPFFVYDIDNSGYRFFDFSNNMFANSNPVLPMPSSIGYTPQMAVIDPYRNNVLASARWSYMFAGFHPTVTQNLNYYENDCYQERFEMEYHCCHFDRLDRISNLYFEPQSRINLNGYTSYFPDYYKCGSFFQPNSENDQNEGNTLGSDDAANSRHNVYPTVVSEANATLWLELTDAAAHEIAIRIFDVSGKLLYQQNGNTTAGSNRIEVRAQNLAPGVNIMHVSGLEKPVITKILRK